MRERLLSAGVISAAVLLAGVIVATSRSHGRVVKALEDLALRMPYTPRSVSVSVQAEDPFEGLQKQLRVAQPDGSSRVITAGEGEHASCIGFFVEVREGYALIHMPTRGEAINSAKKRLLVSLASVATIEGLSAAQPTE